VSETETSTTPPREQGAYERCDQCSSPVDKAQRYCVVCGSRNKGAEDPVARYLAVATSRARAATRSSASRPASERRRRASGLGTAAVIAAIPLAVALGVIVGRANSGGDGKLIAALRAQKAPVVKVTGGGPATSSDEASAATPAVTSTFTLSKGYTVELRTLPLQGASQATVASAEAAAKAKGATGVGVVDEQGFSLSPKPSGDVYVVYSGQYTTKAAAAAALTKLKRRFPSAVVIAVQQAAKSSSTSSSGSSSSAQHATVSKKALAQGKNEANQISHATGKGYENAQNNLPGEVSIP
jgi:SPOR domain